MTTAHIAHNIGQVLKAADAAGAALPEHLDQVARHALALETITTATAAETVDALLDKLGDRKAFDKALPDALTALSRIDAANTLRRNLTPRAHTKAWELIVSEREGVAAAVGRALAPQLRTLADRAAGIPATVVPSNLEALDPEQFTAWRICQPAAATLEAVAAGLQPLYPSNPDAVLNHRVLPRLPLVAPPDTLPNAASAYRFVDAIEGRRTLGLGSATANLNSDTEGFWPARVAAAGGTFVWAGPQETRDRAERLRTACAQRKTPATATA